MAQWPLVVTSWLIYNRRSNHVDSDRYLISTCKYPGLKIQRQMIYFNKTTLSLLAALVFLEISVLHFFFFLPLVPSPSSPWHVFLQGLSEKLGLIYVSRCAVSPIGNVCVMASLRGLSRRMRIGRSRWPVQTLCRQASAGNPEPSFNPPPVCHFHQVPLVFFCFFFPNKTVCGFPYVESQALSGQTL